MDFINGGISGMVEVAATQPLEVCKIRIQTSMGMPRALHQFYRGMVPRLAGIVPTRCVFWGVQRYIQRTQTWIVDENARAVVAGASAGVLQTVVDTPFDRLKTHLITQRGGARHPIALGSMYRGFGWSLPRNAIFASCVALGVARPADTPAQTAAGAAAGATVGCVLSQPLDTMRTIAQAAGVRVRPPLFSGLLPRIMVSNATMFVGSWTVRVLEELTPR